MQKLLATVVALSIATTVTLPFVGIAYAGKRSAVDSKQAKAALVEAKAQLSKAKAAAKLAAHEVKLARAREQAAKAAKRLEREQWVADCLDERTGPAEYGGVSVEEAIAMCQEEVTFVVK